jgi:hypothetical protein
MPGKFADVPVEPDTVVLAKDEVEIDGVRALFEIWFWEGIEASSLIFSSNDIAHLTDQALLAWLVDKGYLEKDDLGTATIKRNKNGFDFINYRFTMD